MKRTHIIFILLAGLMISCVPEKKVVERTVVQNNGDPNWNPNNPGGTPTPTPTPTGTSSGNEDYIIISDVVVHGKASGTVVWRSNNTNHTGGLDPRAFSTDQKLYIQIIPRKDSKYSEDVDGVNCGYYTLNYSKLKMKIRVASVEYPGQGSSCSFTSSLNTPSSIIQLPIPTGSSYPPVIEITNVETDYTCNSYCNPQNTTNVQACKNAYCPYFEAGVNDCVGFDIRIATDETDPLPGAVKNCGDL